MKYQHRFRSNKGFSLIELIIAIAILVILTGFLAPRFMKYIEKSRESVCRKDMDEMLNIYRVEHVSDDGYSVQNVVDKYQGECPSGGEYADASVRMGQPWIMCSYHDAEDWDKISEVIMANKYYNAMREFAGESIADVAKSTGIPANNIRNDTLREYLYNKMGGWPSMSEDFLRQYGISGSMYVQPYLNMHSGTDESGTEKPGRPLDKTNKDEDVILFANGNGTAGGNWGATLIYNPETETWYKGPKSNSSVMVKGKTWSEIENEIKDWIPLK